MKAIVDWLTEPWRAHRAYNEALNERERWLRDVLNKVPFDEAICQRDMNSVRIFEAMEWSNSLTVRGAFVACVVVFILVAIAKAVLT